LAVGQAAGAFEGGFDFIEETGSIVVILGCGGSSGGRRGREGTVLMNAFGVWPWSV
jgi:hypothetical protein